ncbi:MAG: hypothetical protein KatS3mg059_0142 [Thermomicrobiales bacterium]|nr:MAG: hypothetical protein KatS3mg059_0142 [Thermomicrobiales bacterium]
MFRLFRRSLMSGVATNAYPLAPEPAPEAFRGQVMLRTDRCRGTGDCARACPSAAITVERAAPSTWTWTLDDARCVFCGLCEAACPNQAIVLSTEFELATKDASDLVTEVTFGASPETVRTS